MVNMGNDVVNMENHVVNMGNDMVNMGKDMVNMGNDVVNMGNDIVNMGKDMVNMGNEHWINKVCFNNNNNNNLLFIHTLYQFSKGASRIIITNFSPPIPLTRPCLHTVRRKVIIISNCQLVSY